MARERRTILKIVIDFCVERVTMFHEITKLFHVEQCLIL